MYSKDKSSIRKVNDRKNGITYVLLKSTLENNYSLYIRMPITPIQDSASISNRIVTVIMAQYSTNRYGGVDDEFSVVISGVTIMLVKMPN